MNRKSLQVWLPTDLHERLDSLARRERRSKGAQVAVILEKELSKELRDHPETIKNTASEQNLEQISHE